MAAPAGAFLCRPQNPDGGVFSIFAQASKSVIPLVVKDAAVLRLLFAN
jgi:hypothetical protein